MKKILIATRNPVPMEENSRRYIASDKPVSVTMSAYYSRRMMQGELVEYVPPVPVKSVASVAPAPIAKPEEK